MELSLIEREAIQSQLNDCEQSGRRVWIATRTLEGGGFIFKVQISEGGYILTLSRADQEERKLVYEVKVASSTKAISLHFLQSIDDLFHVLTSGTDADTTKPQ
jgi:hypothetical protein